MSNDAIDGAGCYEAMRKSAMKPDTAGGEMGQKHSPYLTRRRIQELRDEAVATSNNVKEVLAGGAYAADTSEQHNEEMIALCDLALQAYPAEPAASIPEQREPEKCGACAATFIPRRGEYFPCVLSKGHEGNHLAGGTCAKHGPYVMQQPGQTPQCPYWPDCVSHTMNVPALQPPITAPLEESARTEASVDEIVFPPLGDPEASPTPSPAARGVEDLLMPSGLMVTTDDHNQNVRAAYLRGREQWVSVETVPDSGNLVLVYSSRTGTHTVAHWNSYKQWWQRGIEELSWKPTHWRELDSPAIEDKEKV